MVFITNAFFCHKTTEQDWYLCYSESTSAPQNESVNVARDGAYH